MLQLKIVVQLIYFSEQNDNQKLLLLLRVGLPYTVVKSHLVFNYFYIAR